MPNIRQEIHRQLREITILLVKKSIVIHQKWPIFDSKKRQIVWEGFKNIAFSLKNESYETIYNNIVEMEDYNFLLLDGAVIQMIYEFDHRDNIVGHILSFYPHYDLTRYQDMPEEYEKLFYGNNLFVDIREEKVVTFPLRFDFSQTHNEIIHPKVHLTLGNYRDCRIPVSKPLPPNRFISFILRNFYFQKFKEAKIEESLKDDLLFDETITQREKNLLHLHYL